MAKVKKKSTSIHQAWPTEPPPGFKFDLRAGAPRNGDGSPTLIEIDEVEEQARAAASRASEQRSAQAAARSRERLRRPGSRGMISDAALLLTPNDFVLANQKHAVRSGPAAAVVDAFHCGICLELKTHPVVIGTCGHSFCAVCLRLSIAAIGFACPLCKTVIKNDPKRSTDMTAMIDHVFPTTQFPISYDVDWNALWHGIRFPK
ncbi:hypothetical protein R3P38DRAFT_3027088 [Favolaschia claudopus]|uniref:RING-type domain-containing protein n=1 Tax=Favolaschia claudopus TaxID=2862362 RepID=A0AAW0AFD3_9AGAR